ncbi:Protein of unknown function DUF4817 [Trinorchestia longiramus]|nr:Protein of unknown function DUF4817 [Trinorchestia longiramus]
MQLTKDQRTFIVLEFKETKSCTQLRGAYYEKFPESNSPNKKTVYRTVRTFYKHGSIVNRNKENFWVKNNTITEDNIVIVRQIIAENPRSSGRRNESCFTKTFHIILKKNLCVHPYRMQIKHQSLPPDDTRRSAFCNWITVQQPRFVERLVVTDEAVFSMRGSVNTQNTRFNAMIRKTVGAMMNRANTCL